MRLRACIALLLLAIGGCAQIPDHIRVEVDGGSIDFQKTQPPADPVGNAADPDANGVDDDGR